MTVNTTNSGILALVVEIEFRIMSGSLNVFEIIVFGSLGFGFQVIIEMDEVFVDSVDELIAFFQTSVQIIVHVLIIVLFGGIFFSRQVGKEPFGRGLWRR